MQIDSAQVMKLREATGLGMMLCKQALIEAEGNMEKAIENLRKQGQATAAKRAGKSAKEGKVTVILQNENAVVYEINCETDFVSRGTEFTTFSEVVGTLLLTHKPKSMDEALQLTSPVFNGQTINAKIMEMIAKIGEKISFRRFQVFTIDTTKKQYGRYVHGNGKIGIIVIMEPKNSSALNTPELTELGKDLAMQVAASKPIAVNRALVPTSVLEKEKEIYAAQAQTSGKPEKIWDKIIEGKLVKFYKDFTLLEQIYIKDTERSVTDRIADTEKQLNTSIAVESFVRFELGSEE
ncbi:MAG: elongation factor Ts [Chitinivibrionales bacterium]|nr:elongation factor Ts [Chitinivibrionales bacterium]